MTASKATLAKDNVTARHGSSAQGQEQTPTPDQEKPTTVSSGTDKEIASLDKADSLELEKQGASSETHPETEQQHTLGVPTTGHQVQSDKIDKQSQLGVGTQQQRTYFVYGEEDQQVFCQSDDERKKMQKRQIVCLTQQQRTHFVYGEEDKQVFCQSENDEEGHGSEE